jgi:hypothetical protein
VVGFYYQGGAYFLVGFDLDDERLISIFRPAFLENPEVFNFVWVKNRE